MSRQRQQPFAAFLLKLPVKPSEKFPKLPTAPARSTPKSAPRTTPTGPEVKKQQPTGYIASTLIHAPQILQPHLQRMATLHAAGGKRHLVRFDIFIDFVVALCASIGIVEDLTTTANNENLLPAQRDTASRRIGELYTAINEELNLVNRYAYILPHNSIRLRIRKTWDVVRLNQAPRVFRTPFMADRRGSRKA